MPAALLRSTACLRQQGQQHGRELQNQKQEDFCSTVLEAELLQLLRHCRVQLEQLQRNPGVGVATPVWSSSNNSSRREGDILVPSEYAVKSAAAWARLLQVSRLSYCFCCYSDSSSCCLRCMVCSVAGAVGANAAAPVPICIRVSPGRVSWVSTSGGVFAAEPANPYLAATAAAKAARAAPTTARGISARSCCCSNSSVRSGNAAVLQQ